NTSKMLFSAQRYIAEITKYITLHPGDVIWLGTDDATEPNLADGQVCEIVQKEIGVLRNPVVREKA
ncbi:MAG: fumarylacetoacetate hydrolase family protein, partial [Burkholderiales bacterium]|nr:fumarylacetoacetate hydrolase family protein [Burkholderiales bacterium]